MLVGLGTAENVLAVASLTPEADDDLPPLPVLLEGKAFMVWWIGGHPTSGSIAMPGDVLVPTNKYQSDHCESTILHTLWPEEIVVKLAVPAHDATITLDPGTSLVIQPGFHVEFWTDRGPGRGLELDTSGADTLRIKGHGDVLCEVYSIRDTHARLTQGDVYWVTCASVSSGIVRLSSPTSIDTHMLVGGQSLCLAGQH